MTRTSPLIGQELADLRRSKLLTQREAAEQLGCSLRAWQDWEAGLAPRFKWQRALIQWAATVAA